MLEKPRLADEKIAACLNESYGLSISEIEFLPLGYDSAAGVYRVWAGGQAYFLKVKSDPPQTWSVLLPRYLQAQGFAQIIAPLPTLDGGLWGQVDHFTLIVYPFIEQTDSALSEAQWIAFGSVLRRLHHLRLPAEIAGQIPRETFVPHPALSALTRDLLNSVGRQTYDHPVQQQLAAFWQSQRREIGLMLDRAGQLGRRLQGRAPDFVLCHADIHTGNLMVDPQGRLYVVDWDQPVLAPKERDLMFVTVGAFVMDPREETLFFEGYGSAEIDPLTLAYYRYERTMQDLAEFAAQVFLRDTSDETKHDSLKWFMIQFEPGNSVETAHRLDQVVFDE